MELFSKQSDRRIERDALYEIVRQEFKLTNDFDFIDLMHSKYTNHRHKVASLQMLAEKAAHAGSQSAKNLYDDASKELCLLVRSIRDRLEFENKPFQVSHTGGLFSAGELIMPQFKQGIKEAGGKLTPPKYDPAEGALLIAFSKIHPNEPPKTITKRLQSNPQPPSKF